MQKAWMVAWTLLEKFLVHCGLPEKILTDQGYNLENGLIKELCNLTRVKKLCTTPYRLEMNGQCEQFNSTLISILGTLPQETKNLKFNWSWMVLTLVHAFNCTKANTTDFSPYYLMYRR